MLKKQTLFSIAIALIFVFFIGYGIEVFSSTPDYGDFCDYESLRNLQNEKACLAAGGEWEAYPQPQDKLGHCTTRSDCRDGYQEAREIHDMIVFIVSIIIGLLTITVAVMLKKEIVSSGLIGGSVLLILYGTIRYWEYAHDVLKFVLLGVALVVLIWLAYKKLENK